MKLITWIVALLLWVSLPANAVLSDIEAEVAKQTHYNIVMSENSYPLQFVDDEGQAKGLLIDIWREWGQVTHSRITFLPMPWQQGLDYIRDNPSAIHAGLAPTLMRKQQFSFADTFTSLATYLYVHKTIANRKQISELIPYRIGLVGASAHEEHLLNIEPRLTFKRYRTREALLNAAATGEVLVFAGIEGYQRNHRLENDVANHFYSSHRLPISAIKLQPAVNKQHTNLIDIINQGFAAISPDVLHQIQRRWLGYTEAGQIVKVATQVDVEPYVHIANDGVPRGLLIDLWRLWSQRTGIEIEFVTADMESSIELLKQGRADIHIGYPESSTMRTGLNQVAQILSVRSRLFSLNDSIEALNNNDNLRLGLFPTSPYINEVKSTFPSAQIRFYDDLDSMVEASDNNDIQGFIASTALTSQYLLKHNLWERFHQFTQFEFITDMYSLVRLEDRGLADRITAGFNLISLQEKSELEAKWLINSADRYYPSPEFKLSLTERERRFISSLGVLRMGYVKNWAPMEFQGDNGEFLGVNSDIQRLLTKHLGLTIIPVAYDEFSDVLRDVMTGEIQLVASVAYTAQRTTKLSFSEPYWPSPWAVVTQLTQPAIFNLTQLSGHRLAVIEGYHLINTIKQRHPGVTIIEVPNIAEGIDAVATKQADMFVGKVAALAYELNEGQYTNLKLSVIADLAEQHSRLAVFADLQALIPLVDRVLRSIDETEQDNIYQKWVTQKLKRKTNLQQPWMKFILLGLLILFVMVATFSFSNRRLKSEMARREKAEETLVLVASHDDVTKLPNRSLFMQRLDNALKTHQQQQAKFALLLIDLDGFKAINDIHGHDIGDKLLKLVAGMLASCIHETDTVARLGGNEFVIILNNITSKNSANLVAEHILNRLNQLNTVGKHRVSISASIGLAIYPDDASEAYSMLSAADKLMFQAKKFGGRQCKQS